MSLLRLLPIALLLLLPPMSAAADGVPSTDLGAGPDGVLGPGDKFRFGALPTPGGTVVTKTATHGGRVLQARVLEGSWEVPVVTNDGTSGGSRETARRWCSCERGLATRAGTRASP
jgi:hypothetical protein